jgi:DNA repair exonuclease SbcCD ATPase subunit
MQVQHITIKNFKGIEALDVPLNGCNVYAIGPNGSGKSSFIDAVFKTLTGKNLPSKLTKEGAAKGSVFVDLGDINVEAAFDAKKEKMALTVSAPEGGAYASPRTMLDALVGTIDFDVAGFLALTPRKQVEQLKAMLGLDLSDLDAEYKATFEERADSNKQLKWLQSNVKPYDRSKTERVDVEAVRAELGLAHQHNWEVKNKASERSALYTRMERESHEVKRLEALLAQANANLIAARDEYMVAEAWLAANEPVETAALQSILDNATAHNAAVEATEKELAHRADVRKEEENNARLCALLTDIEARKAARIRAVEMPVAGLSFTDEGLLLDGLPLESEQVNTAKQIIAGLQLCGLLHKQVKIARFDGSLLDNHSLRQVEEWAAAHGIQLFIELVDREETGGLRVVVSE